MIQKLGVCGCSWSSEDYEPLEATGYGTYVSELLDIPEYKNYGRPSSSNYVIRLQVEQAIKDGCDFIIVAWTNVERVEWITQSGDDFVPEKGLQNISYESETNDILHNKNILYHPCGKDGVRVTFSESLSSMQLEKSYDEIVENNPAIPHILTRKQFETWQLFYMHNYDLGMEELRQYYLIESAVCSLQRNKVKFLMVPGWKSHVENSMFADWPIIPKKNYVMEHPVDLYNKRKQADPDFESQYVHHLLPEDEILYAKQYLIPRINELI